MAACEMQSAIAYILPYRMAPLLYENGQRLSVSGVWPRDAVTGVSGVSIDSQPLE